MVHYVKYQYKLGILINVMIEYGSSRCASEGNGYWYARISSDTSPSKASTFRTFMYFLLQGLTVAMNKAVAIVTITYQPNARELWVSPSLDVISAIQTTKYSPAKDLKFWCHLLHPCSIPETFQQKHVALAIFYVCSN